MEVKTTCRNCGNTWFGTEKMCSKCGQINSYSELIRPIPVQEYVRSLVGSLRIKGNHYHADLLEKGYLKRSR